MDTRYIAISIVIGFVAGLASCASWSYIQYVTGLFR